MGDLGSARQQGFFPTPDVRPWKLVVLDSDQRKREADIAI